VTAVETGDEDKTKTKKKIKCIKAKKRKGEREGGWRSE
jgi:hypothetical protein